MSVQPLFRAFRFVRSGSIILFLLALFAGCARPAEQTAPRAARGVLDLRSWKFETDGPVKLDGEWEFYWHELLSPDSPPPEASYITVPSQWQNETVIRHGIPFRPPAHGFATYRLKVLLPPEHPALGVSMNDAGMAHRTFINGIEHWSNGIVGKSADEMKLFQQYRIFPLQAGGNELTFLIQVSNFQYWKAGLWHTTELADLSTLTGRQKQNFAIDMAVFSSLLIMGLYHLGLYAGRRRDRSPLFFGIFCVLVALRTICIKERLILDAFPMIPFEIVHRIEFISIYYGSLVFLQFIRALYPDEFGNRTYLWFLWFFGIAGASVILTPLSIYTRGLTLVQIGILLGIAYTMYVILRALIHDRFGAGRFLVGLIVFFAAVGHDILRTTGFFHTPFLASYGLLFFVFSQAVVLSGRFSHAFLRSEKLTEDLKELSEHLEEKVKERTEELRTSLTRIRRDLRFAQNIQSQMLPLAKTSEHGLRICCRYLPMEEVGGDLFDISRAGDVTRILIADATGHGVQAAMVTMLIKSEYEGMKESFDSPAQLLKMLNNMFTYKYAAFSLIFTCAIIDIDTKAGKIRYASAGHPPQILLTQGEAVELARTGKIVGLLPQAEYEEGQADFTAGDRLFLFTDGVFEQFNETEFGEERLRQCILALREADLASQTDGIIAALKEFLAGTPAQDDIALVAIERVG